MKNKIGYFLEESMETFTKLPDISQGYIMSTGNTFRAFNKNYSIAAGSANLSATKTITISSPSLVSGNERGSVLYLITASFWNQQDTSCYGTWRLQMTIDGTLRAVEGGRHGTDSSWKKSVNAFTFQIFTDLYSTNHAATVAYFTSGYEDKQYLRIRQIMIPLDAQAAKWLPSVTVTYA